MNNHPNRGWRKHMQAAADQWLQTPAAQVLIDLPLDPQHRISGMHNRIREAYLAGYQDCRTGRLPGNRREKMNITIFRPTTPAGLNGPMRAISAKSESMIRLDGELIAPMGDSPRRLRPIDPLWFLPFFGEPGNPGPDSIVVEVEKS